MDHPEIVMRNANLRYDQLLQSAQAYRRSKTVSGNHQTWFHGIMRMLFQTKTDKKDIRSDAPAILDTTG
jgi:hypothetical protein